MDKVSPLSKEESAAKPRNKEHIRKVRKGNAHAKKECARDPLRTVRT